MFPDWERWKFIFPPDKHFLSFIYQIINNLRAIFYINDVLSVWRVCGLNSLYFISLSHLPTTTSLDSNLFPHTVFVPQENKPRENLILTGLVWSFIKKKLGRNKIKLDKTTTLKFTKSSRHKKKARKIWLSDSMRWFVPSLQIDTFLSLDKWRGMIRSKCGVGNLPGFQQLQELRWDFGGYKNDVLSSLKGEKNGVASDFLYEQDWMIIKWGWKWLVILSTVALDRNIWWNYQPIMKLNEPLSAECIEVTDMTITTGDACLI